MRLITITAAVSALALASACGSESPASTEATLESPPETQQEAALEVDVLDCGTIEVSDLDAFSSAGDYAGEDRPVDGIDKVSVQAPAVQKVV